MLNGGSFTWLLAHDLRLNWRQFTAMFVKGGRATSWGIVLGGLFGLHALAAMAVDPIKPYLAANSGFGVTQIAVAQACVLAWMVSQGLLGTARMLWDRGDLDLLIGSPLPASRIFAARMIALAVSSLGSAGLLIFPIANAGAVLDGLSWLAIYPVLTALALIGTALGSGLAMGLFFLVGPRRARLISQLTAALVAGAFVLSIQIVALLPDAVRATVREGMPNLGFGPVAEFTAAALRGQLWALIGLLALALVVYATLAVALGRRFAMASARSAEAPPAGHRSTPEAALRACRFGAGLGPALRRKEWRLLVRDPGLFAQLSLQIIYTLPVAVILLRSGESIPAAVGLAPVIVVIALQVAASLSWIVVSAEDAPELIAAAPVRSGDVDCAKLSAVALPVAAIIGGPILGLMLFSPLVAVLTALYAAAGASMGAFLNFWHPMPGKRRGMLRRHAQSKVVAIVEHALALLWALAIVLAIIGSLTTFVPIALALCVLFGFARTRSCRPLQHTPQSA